MTAITYRGLELPDETRPDWTPSTTRHGTSWVAASRWPDGKKSQSLPNAEIYAHKALAYAAAVDAWLSAWWLFTRQGIRSATR